MSPAWVVLAASLGALATVLGGYPVTLVVLDRLRGRDRRERRAGIPQPGTQAAGAQEPAPSVSILVAVRNGRELVLDKVRNALASVPPESLAEVVLVSDGSEDGTNELVEALDEPRLAFLALERHLGKARALNEGIRRCTGDVIVFTDADARLAPDAVPRLLARFADPTVGGVSGQRVVGDDETSLTDAQRRYLKLDGLVKVAESRRGSTTSNDGKLHAVRRSLVRPVADGVTDDLWLALNVVAQGRRFVYEPSALAVVRTPSRSPLHELARRRRIVCRSLRGIFRMRGLLDPRRHGRFAVGLLVNKVGRRGLPLFLATTLLSSAWLAPSSRLAALLFALQALLYGAALLHELLGRGLPAPLRKISGTCFYFVLGAAGTALGVLDFLANREVTRWDPVKAG